MLPRKDFTSVDILSILVRRRWFILLPFALGLAVAPLIAARVPELYRSETLIMVIPQRVPDSYVRSTVTATVEDRLPSISDQILSRTRLERIINDFGLYREERAKGAMEDIVAKMRKDIGRVEIQPGQQSFRVSYESEDPATAQKVTARLASLFIEENSRDRENLAESTNVFLESALEEAKQRLVEHETKLENFKRRYSGELPAQLSINLQAIANAQLQLQGLNESQNRTRERRLLLERQLADAKALPAMVPQVIANPQESAAGLTAAQQLELVETRLEAMRQKFTADHPDVRAVERTAAALRAKAQEEALAPVKAKPVVLSPAEQARQERMRELQAQLEVIDHQLSVAQDDESKLRTLIADYQRKVEAAPSREAELVELTRDYDILKKSYDSLLTKREDSNLAADLERRQIGEQFRILDPASLPENPDNYAQRIASMFVGAIVGLVLGLCVTVFLEYRDASFKSEEDILRALNLPVLALVPTMTTAQERRYLRRRRIAIDVVAGLLVVASVTMVGAWGMNQF
jgi:polysaccharide chain length determinant protein (PEP-CTERM system associated)